MCAAQSSTFEAGARTGRDARNRDRRVDERYELTGTRGSLVYKQSAKPCEFVDISLGGCCLRTDTPFEAGALAPIEIVLPMHGIVVRICGVTQWISKQNNLIGIRFIHPSLRTKNELAGLLIGLVDKAAAEVVKEIVSSTPFLQSRELSLTKDKLPPRAENWSRADEALKTNAQIDAEWIEHERLDKKRDRLEKEEAIAGTALAAPSPAAHKIPAASPQPATVETAPAAPSACTPSDGSGPRVTNSGDYDWSATMRFLPNPTPIRGELVDLSLTGCIFRTPAPFAGKTQARVEVEFLLRGLPFRLGGTTTGAYDKRTLGIAFSEMSSRRREELIQVLDELIEENKP